MSSDMARQRAEIEGVIAGRTLCDELRQVAETSGEAPAYSDEAGVRAGGWQSLTWSQARQRVLEVAAGFAALGLAPGERVALMLPNRSEHVLADLGAVHAGGLGVTLYATLAPEQVAYVAADCDARIAVLDGRGRTGPLAAGPGPAARARPRSSSGTRTRARPATGT